MEWNNLFWKGNKIKNMTIFHDEAHSRYVSKSGNPHAGGRRAVLPNLGLCHCESEPKTKGGFEAVCPMGTIVFSSEILSPRAQEQLRQLHSKVKGIDNAGNSRERSGKPLCFRHHRENWQQPKSLEATWLEQSCSVPEQFLWFWLSSSSTVVCAANLPQNWQNRWFSLKELSMVV